VQNTEAELAVLRKQLASVQQLSSTRASLTSPVKRRRHGEGFSNTAEVAMLRDVHTLLTPAGSEYGRTERLRLFVKGSYEYYHYGQGANDHGWGCAYRSAQTIFSWYDVHNVPTIEDMQRELVRIGDKPASFIKSTQWIGSVEISLLLDSMHNIACKIVNIQNEKGLGSDASQELINHMQTVGSPVFVGGQGGGARAILGLELSADAAGILKFLVLDPHYSGNDSFDSIEHQISRVCTWESPSALCHQYGSFTNFCLPQPLDEGVAGRQGIQGTVSSNSPELTWEFEVVESS
jgi:hypothetical protein